MKICVLGCGLRTPLLLHGILHSEIRPEEIALYDVDPGRAELMAKIGAPMADGRPTALRPTAEAERAIEGSSFVISSFRAGDMRARAADERLALECGFAGQETTGPAGFAMALRTVPVALRYARMVERVAPGAWIVNFTNPAGLITQAIHTHTKARVVGICDTPAELMLQISRALGASHTEVHCDYVGLNHLGWVRSVKLRGQEMLGRLLADETLLRRLYPAELFAPEHLAALGLLPTEYVFFYYSQEKARRNQSRTGATRGEELQRMNGAVWEHLDRHARSGDAEAALRAYRSYLNRRNASYLKLEGAGESAFAGEEPDWNPFEGETGYHRIAVEAIAALSGPRPVSMILNVPNRGCIAGLEAGDVVETTCLVSDAGARPVAAGRLPASVEGLVFSVKQYERLTIEAAIEESWEKAVLALSTNPIVGDWEAARNFLVRLAEADPAGFPALSREAPRQHSTA